MGTTESGKKAAKTSKRKYGNDHHSKIAARATRSWEANGRKPRGFAAISPERRRELALKSAEARRKKKESIQEGTEHVSR